MEVIAHDRKTEQVYGKVFRLHLYRRLDPAFTVIVIVAGNWIVSHQETTSDESIEDVGDFDRIRIELVGTIDTSHDWDLRSEHARVGTLANSTELAPRLARVGSPM